VRYLTCALVIIILVVVPPRSRVVEPSKCLGYISGMCLDDGAVPEEQTLIQTDGSEL